MYPPYLGAGIKIADYSEDMTRFEVVMNLRWYNKNLVGTHFGGSLYSMCDPFYMFILITNLGKDYIVWDKSGCIDFLKPGKGKVTAIFEVSKEKLQAIKEEIDRIGKNTYTFHVEIKDEKGDTVAKLKKGVYVRKKN